MSRIKGAEPCRKKADPEIIMVKAIVSALATCMLYTGHENPRVNEADIRYTFHYTATYATCVIARLYRAIAAWRGSDGLDGERIYKFNFEIKLRSVEEKEAFKRRLSKVRDLLTPPGSSKIIDNLGRMYEFFDGLFEFC